VLNLDNFCLFYALELARIFHDQTELNALKKDGAGNSTGLISNQVFRNIRNNPNRQRAMAVDLMSAVNIPQDFEQYGMEHLSEIQEYYDQVIKSLKTNSINICRNILGCIALYVSLMKKFQLLYGRGLLEGNMRLPSFMTARILTA
jgi:ubiquitin C-terminal hydrolase